MSSEQLADACLKRIFQSIDVMTYTLIAGPRLETWRREFADAIRAAAVDDAIRADVLRELHGLLDAMKATASVPNVVGARWDKLPSNIQADLRRLAEKAERETGLSYMQLPNGMEFHIEPNVAALERLAFLLGLSLKKQEFLCEPRMMSVQPGQVAVFTIPDTLPVDEHSSVLEMAKQFAEKHQVQVVVMFKGQTLDMLDEEAMHRAGWVRAADTPHVIDEGPDDSVVRDPPENESPWAW